MTIDVIGDAMIDCYEHKTLPGGAALLASMCDGNLYAHITSEFRSMFPELKTDNCKIISKMTTKVYENGMKIDFDVIENYDYNFVPQGDLILFSDYGKGCLNNVVLPKNRITIVDPKCRPLNRWEGCTIFKCNKKEAMYLAGTNNMKEAAKFLKTIIKCEMVIITLGAEGIVGYWKKLFEHAPKKVIAVNCVGAGDRVCASLAIYFVRMKNNGYTNLEEAAIYACEEATKYVQNPRC